MGDKLKFTPFSPKYWNGRYRTTNADENTFHIKYNSEIKDWWPFVVYCEDDCTADCPAVDNGDIRELVSHINSVKYSHTYNNGGAFSINEFGQVIVPVSYTSRMLVGEIEGKILFEDSLNSGIMDLENTDSLSPGDIWNRPYLGTVYNYNPSEGVLYREKKGAPAEHPLYQDHALNANLNLVRGYEYCRFIVNPWGIVLVKKEVAWKQWEKVYVGMINPELWFEKEY